jgi:hypothetical protein
MSVQVVVGDAIELVKAQRLTGPVDAHDSLVVEESARNVVEGRAGPDDVDRLPRVTPLEIRVLLGHQSHELILLRSRLQPPGPGCDRL